MNPEKLTSCKASMQKMMKHFMVHTMGCSFSTPKLNQRQTKNHPIFPGRIGLQKVGWF